MLNFCKYNVIRIFLIFISFFYLIALRLFQPIYADEIIYLIVGGRFLVEDCNLWHSTVECSGSTKMAVPYVFYPAFIFRSLFYKLTNVSIYFLDIISILKVTTIGILYFCLCRIYNKDRSSFVYNFLFLVMLGANAVFFVMNRPESSLLMQILLCLLILELNLYPVLIIVLIYYWSISFHPQVLPFIIFFVVCGIYKSKNKIFTSLAIAAFIYISICGYSLWTSYFSCPEGTFVYQFFNEYSVTIGGFFTDFFGSIYKVNSFLFEFFQLSKFMMFRSSWTVGMITVSPYYSNLLSLILNIIIFIFVSIMFSVVFVNFYYFIKKNKSLRIILFDPYSCLFISLILWGAIRGKYAYVTPLPWGILVLLFIRIVCQLKDRKQIKYFKLFSYISIFGTLLTVVYSVCLHVVGINRNTEVVSVNNDLAISRVSYLKRNLDAIPKECRFVLNTKGRLLLDEATIFLIPDYGKTLIATYGITGYIEGGVYDEKNLKKLQVDNFLVSCSRSYQLKNISSYARDDLCCGSVSY